ncbi:MAG: hypothetical protein ACLU9S_22890 [Oscillospiraceae bacterium]
MFTINGGYDYAARMTLVGDTGLNLGSVSKIDGSAFASMVYDQGDRTAGSVHRQVRTGWLELYLIGPTLCLCPGAGPDPSGTCRVPVPA